MSAPTTLGALLLDRAARPPRDDLYFRDPEGLTGALEPPRSWAWLADQARSAATALAARGVVPGDRVLLALGHGPGLLVALFGTLLLGAVAVPLPPPRGSMAHLRRVTRDCGPRVVIVPGDAAALSAGTARWPGAPPLDPGAPAVLQYTSGSTRRPRGAVLSHRALVANLAAVEAATGAGADDTFVCWVPLFHDLGLVGHLLASLWCGARLVLLPTGTLAARPAAWLETIAAHGGTFSGAPPFAWSLCARHVSAGAAAALDLRAWRIALLAGEVVHPSTVDRFLARFAPSGLRPEAVRVSYGLAECCAAATLTRAGPPAADARLGHRVVSVGPPVPGMAVRVVDDTGAPAPAGTEGHVQVAGSSLMDGYLGEPRATAALRDGPWLRTGDRGYLAGGSLHVTGRTDERIIATGRVIAPTDLEAAAEEVEHVRAACAVGIPDEPRGTEAIVVLVEAIAPEAAWPRILREVRAACLAEVGLPADRVVVLPPGTLPRTTSGKLRRLTARRQWLAGELAGPE